jgi:enamine deaminase RidA (YjgF/YER057c/UK114 family)
MSTRHINPEGLLRSPAFSQAVVVEQPAKTLYIGGQNGVDVHGRSSVPRSGSRQPGAPQPRDHPRERGASLANIVHWRIAVVEDTRSTGTPPSSRHGTRPTHRRHHGHVVAARPRVLVEIDAVAVI